MDRAPPACHEQGATRAVGAAHWGSTAATRTAACKQCQQACIAGSDLQLCKRQQAAELQRSPRQRGCQLGLLHRHLNPAQPQPCTKQSVS